MDDLNPGSRELATALDAAYAEVGAAIDEVRAADRAIRQGYADRARAIDKVRQLTEGAVRISHRDTPQGWSLETTIARQARSEVASALRVPDSTAGNLIAHSATLVHAMPSTLTALDKGDISYRHASTLVEEAWSIPEESWEDFESTLLPEAETMTVSQFKRKARKVRETTHPESIAVRRAKALSDRYIQFTPAKDGMAYLTLYLAAEDALAIQQRVTTLARSQQDGEEDRTLTQLRADTATHLLTCGEVPVDNSPAGDDRDDDFYDEDLDHGESNIDTASDEPAENRTIPAPHGGLGRGIRATVFVTVPVLTMLGHSDEPAQLDGYGPIDLQTALRLVGTAPSMIRLLTDPETGTVLSVGRTRYAIPTDLRRWVGVRDGTCRADGCSNPANDCEIDHTIEWQDGGATEAGNLASLCKMHHRLKSNTDWTPTQDGTGDIIWTAPSGKTYKTRPMTRMRPTPSAPDASDLPDPWPDPETAPPSPSATPPDGPPDDSPTAPLAAPDPWAVTTEPTAPDNTTDEPLPF